MNTRTVNMKRLVALAAVVMICAAALVSVAYAYNATYKDTVTESGLTPEETAKYIYVNGPAVGLELPDITATVAIEYDSTTTVEKTVGSDGQTTVTKKTELAPKSYRIESFTTSDGKTRLDASSGKATIYLGDLTVVSKNTDAQAVKLSIGDFDLKDASQGKVSILVDDETHPVDASCIKFASGSSGYTDTFALAAQQGSTDTKSVTVGVYFIVDIDVDSDKFTHGDYTLDTNGNLVGTTATPPSNTLQTTLVVPGFTITVGAVDTALPDEE